MHGMLFKFGVGSIDSCRRLTASCTCCTRVLLRASMRYVCIKLDQVPWFTLIIYVYTFLTPGACA